MKMYSDEEIQEKIQSWGVPFEKIFLVGPADESYCLIGLWLDDIGYRNYIIEDNELARRCVSYLRRIGVQRCGSPADVYELARQNNWPGYGR